MWEEVGWKGVGEKRKWVRKDKCSLYLFGWVEKLKERN
jgi:hypothetical protein